MRVRRTVELVVAVALAVLAFGAVGGAAAAAPVMFRELDAGSRAANIAGEPKSDAGVVLRSAAAARSRMRAWGLDSTAVRRVDFKRKSLVAVLADYQPS